MTDFEDDPTVGDEMPTPESQVSRRLVITGGLGLLAATGGTAWWLTGRQSGNNYAPQRAAAPTPNAQPSTSEPEVPTASPTKELIIAASGIQKLSIPAIKLNNAKASGPIAPQPEPNEGPGLWYYPPQLDQVAWAEGCAMPSVPSGGTTYVFGHSNRNPNGPRGVFDNLPKVAKQDRIQLLTAKGAFTYAATKNISVGFADLTKHQTNGDFGDGSVNDRLVLLTCRIPGGDQNYSHNTVITAMLEDFKPA